MSKRNRYLFKYRIVRPGGKVRFRGLVYQHKDLLPLVGEYVFIHRDRSIDDADCCIFTIDSCFLCNAQNKRKWAAMLTDNTEA